jgi:ribosomal protein S18 acetylase RimI-like enzyme
MSVAYRQGRREDSHRLAEFIEMASGGVVDFMFRDLVAGMTPVQIIAGNLRCDRHPYTFQNTILAEIDNRPVGMALSYPSRFHGLTEAMRNFFPADRLEHLQDFYAARIENSLYLDALAVKPAYRNRGIGRDLLQRSLNRARNSGLAGLSLIVFADNANALGLYRSCGFELVRPVFMQAHPLIPHKGGCLLMNCPT